ncbi:hypothetical protein DKL61_01095 [Gammaproteobacteria bacterium ESL0073]|nr:hypothetical protein DKL61_01095 [Gammaproteobacteria bacterium ESL0073]
MEELIINTPINSLLIFISMFILLFLSAYAGKSLFKKRNKNNDIIDSETSIVLGATLSLLALLIGFVLSIAITGYDHRQAKEENEAIAIGKAFQYLPLLSVKNRASVNDLLQQYLNARIEFFKAGNTTKENEWQRVSSQAQNELWKVVIMDDNITDNILSTYSELYTTRQQTIAGWNPRIPSAAWILLIISAVLSNLLIGYNIRGMRSGNGLIFIMPLLTTAAFFMIAEIDMPGRGIIHIVPHNLIILKQDDQQKK